MQHNGTLYLHAYVVKRDKSPNILDDRYRSDAFSETHIALTKFWPQRQVRKLRHLLADGTEAAAATDAAGAPEAPAEYISYVHPNVTLALLTDHMVVMHGKYPDPSVFRTCTRGSRAHGGVRAGRRGPAWTHDAALAPWSPTHDPALHLDEATGNYKPLLYRNEFWLLREDHFPVNETTPYVRGRMCGCRAAGRCERGAAAFDNGLPRARTRRVADGDQNGGIAFGVPANLADALANLLAAGKVVRLAGGHGPHGPSRRRRHPGTRRRTQDRVREKPRSNLRWWCRERS